MECAEEGLVLQKCWQGLPTCGREVALESPVRLGEGRWRLRHLPAILSTCSQPHLRSGLSRPCGHLDPDKAPQKLSDQGWVLRWRIAPSSGTHPDLASLLF